MNQLPIYFNVYSPSHNGTHFDIYQQNMMANLGVIVPSRDGQRRMLGHGRALSPIETIRKHRCNSVLDLQGHQLNAKEWSEIQTEILNSSWLPPINQIYLQGTGITMQDIDRRLQSIVRL